MVDLENKVAIVTGSATGIGRETAFHLSRKGAAVVINYLDQTDKADDVVDLIKKSGGRAVAIKADVSIQDEVNTLFRRTIEEYSSIDILVNNAGTEKELPFWEIPFDLWSEILAVDLTGPFLCAQAAVRQMIKQGRGGRIINISSVHEDIPMPTNLPYCAAKGGLRMLMRTAAVECAPHKITVNNIAPGAIDTPLDASTKADPKKFQKLLSEIPLERMGKPEEVAGLVCFLASDAASYITGSTYVIDGGMMRQSGSL